ncbi:DNA recombination protein RmuC [Paraferrimonas haliotis]|uniref:DNA recombination protein RmuC n=1 Tax=Paraferrimonas haliotis TaxID=2013866 RepID=A0AA37TSJ4_9GAMM|nr:DNA recombination protein RmuC [Paraferrimonas haliotis]GLS84720.1 DNA recombination protein RmuC [Paraferrimonas haliotis]
MPQHIAFEHFVIAISLVALVIILACVAYFKPRLRSALARNATLQQQSDKLAHLQGHTQAMQTQLQQAKYDLKTLTERHTDLSGDYQAAKAQLNWQQQQLAEAKQQQAQQSQTMKLEFEQLASQLLKNNQSEFSRQSSEQVNHLLTPLKQQLSDFKQALQSNYTNQAKEQHALKHEINALKALNLQMSEEAINLTRALKGDSRQQGDWGEMLLSRILEDSGLREGHEYHTQTQLKNEAGTAYKPDVIVHLPEQKDVVIDSKVSLTAYERYYNCDDEEQAQLHLKAHIASIATHIKQLSQKDYHKLNGVHSLDYVLMFVPLEPAFLLALEHEPNLAKQAYRHNIMLVSPTNLMLALRTISNLWRFQQQEQHAQQIANQAGKMYDKLCNYVDDLDKLGRALDSANKSFANARNKLISGRGNLIRQAEQMKDLGVQSNKQLSSELLKEEQNVD